MMLSVHLPRQCSFSWSSVGQGLGLIFEKVFNHCTTLHATKLACSTDGASPLRRLLRSPKGRCHIMVPAGGANAEGWLAFRDVLARIEAYTSRAAPVQVQYSSCAYIAAACYINHVREQDRASWAFCASTTIKPKDASPRPSRSSTSGAAQQPCQVSMMLNDLS